MAGRRVPSARGGRRDIGTTRNFEAERLIGQSRIFLEIGEVERRPAALAVSRAQGAYLQRPTVDDQREPIVVALWKLG